ncbi:MAG: hypothetical protein ACR2OF_06395 [Hyphomicrobium sp.]
MSFRSIPLIFVVLVVYNVIVWTSGTEILSTLMVPEIKMLSGGIWKFTWGDFIVLLTLIMLFIEIVKATYTSTSSLIDHGLSMLVFVACLIEFLLAPLAANSVFFMIMVAALIDVVAGYTIGIRVARRDLSLGHGG